MEKKALVVDDNADYRTAMATLLEANGYEVATAENGVAGVEEATKTHPDLVVLDVMMEDAGAGLDALKKLNDNAKTADIPVIIMTGIKKAKYLVGSYTGGEDLPNVHAVFEKPVDPAAFEEALTKLA